MGDWRRTRIVVTDEVTRYVQELEEGGPGRLSRRSGAPSERAEPQQNRRLWLPIEHRLDRHAYLQALEVSDVGDIG